jgi:hypothetical protein
MSVVAEAPAARQPRRGPPPRDRLSYNADEPPRLATDKRAGATLHPQRTDMRKISKIRRSLLRDRSAIGQWRMRWHML